MCEPSLAQLVRPSRRTVAMVTERDGLARKPSAGTRKLVYRPLPTGTPGQPGLAQHVSTSLPRGGLAGYPSAINQLLLGN